MIAYLIGETIVDRYLEVDSWRGEALAAYLYLPRPDGARSARTGDEGDGILVDYAPDETVIGIEITAPRGVTIDMLNAVLVRLDQLPMSLEEFAPLRGAEPHPE